MRAPQQASTLSGMTRPKTADSAGEEPSYPALDRLRAALDARGTRRHVFALPGEPITTRDALAGALRVPPWDVVAVHLLEAQGEMVAAIAPAPARLSLGRVADLVGAGRVRLAGPRGSRRWLARYGGGSELLAWWELSFLTGLPTVLDSSLLGRDRLFAPTGQAGWLARLEGKELARVTNAQIGSICAGVIGRRPDSGEAEGFSGSGI